MSRHETSVPGTVIIEGETVTFRSAGTNQVTVARLLGTVDQPGGPAMYLDRLLHRPHHQDFYGYKPSGAVSTILTPLHVSRSST